MRFLEVALCPFEYQFLRICNYLNGGDVLFTAKNQQNDLKVEYSIRLSKNVYQLWGVLEKDNLYPKRENYPRVVDCSQSSEMIESTHAVEHRLVFVLPCQCRISYLSN